MRASGKNGLWVINLTMRHSRYPGRASMSGMPAEQLSQLLGKPWFEVDLGRAALVLAQLEYPDLDPDPYLKKLAAFARSIRSRLPFPNVEEGHWQISTNGGGQPVWGPQGRELASNPASSW